MSELKEYVVSVKSYDDLESLYQDMETAGGQSPIPYRSVECVQRRPTSRNTHYFLTDSEAEALKEDPRVLFVSLTPAGLGLEVRPHYVQTTAYWDKSGTANINTHKNWGLYRTALGQQISNWGSNSTPSQAGTINITSSGKNVDVIITDGHLDPDHPEFAVDSDGTGGSRVNQFNWFGLNPLVTGGTAGTYTYAPYDDPNYIDVYGNPSDQRSSDNDHGCHVAGTSCGNTQGWARDANIYNISPYGTNQNYISITSLFDYMKVFHQTKSINPSTGIKNPTISTNSWGFYYGGTLSSISKINYRGTVYDGPFTASQALGYGIFVYQYQSVLYYQVPRRYDPIEVDIADAIAAGVIILGSAGNDYMKIAASSSDTDWNNYILTSSGSQQYYNRGSSPGSTSNVICVGSLGTRYQEYKDNYSNCGPRVDIYAPGGYIMSSVNRSHTAGTYDSRNDQFFIDKYSGTSMATPQVTGVLACALETYPFMTQSQVLTYIQNYSKYNQMTDGGGSTTVLGSADITALQGSVNRLLYYNRERPIDGQTFPKQNMNKRPTSGQTYPRPRIYSYGQQNSLG